MSLMTNKDKIEQGLRYKEEGNALVKNGEFKKACRSYRRVFGCVNGLLSKDNQEMAKFVTDGSFLTELESKQVKDLKVTVYTNLALCYLKMQEFEKALDCAEKALEIDSDNLKGLLRKGIACNELKLWERGKEALMKALKIDPNNASVKNELITWKAGYAKWAEEQKQKEKSVFGGKLLS